MSSSRQMSSKRIARSSILGRKRWDVETPKKHRICPGQDFLLPKVCWIPKKNRNPSPKKCCWATKRFKKQTNLPFGWKIMKNPQTQQFSDGLFTHSCWLQFRPQEYSKKWSDQIGTVTLEEEQICFSKKIPQFVDLALNQAANPGFHQYLDYLDPPWTICGG